MRNAHAAWLGLLLVVVLAGCSGSTPAPAKQTTPPATTASSAAAVPADSASATANGYDYGYGTYYVATRHKVPPNWGVAKAWYAHAQAAGYSVGNTPKKGAIAWTDRGPHGQVAIVEDVSADGTQVTISEMDGKDGWNRVTTSTAPANSFKYIY